MEKRGYIIALDLHCSFTEMVVLTPVERMRARGRLATTLPTLVEEIRKVPRPRAVVLEEGPIADWMARGVGPEADDVVICDPRRNHLIAKDSDKDDPIDAEKLAHLFRGGFIKRVHHPESFDQFLFKRHVGLYHDSVRERVRLANRLMAELRGYGVFVREAAFADAEARRQVIRALPRQRLIREDLTSLWKVYDASATHAETMRGRLIRQARQEAQIVRFHALPGVKWIRASTFFAYVDTPWRFRSRQALWKYLGIGLERRHSGSGPERVQVPRQVNRALKSSILGAAKSAIASGSNPFAEQHERWLQDGLTPRNACRNVARRLAAVMWGMWKSGDVYRPEQVGRVDALAGVVSSRPES